MGGRSSRSVSERFGALVDSYWSEVHGGKTPGAAREGEYEGGAAEPDEVATTMDQTPKDQATLWEARRWKVFQMYSARCDDVEWEVGFS